MQTLGWLDTVLIGVLLMSAIVGLWRGLVYEVLSLAGWLVAWWCAQVFGKMAATTWLPAGWPAPVAQAIAYAVVFIGALVIWRLLVGLLKQMLHASPVAPVDRALGAGFGVLRGGVIILACVMLVGMTPLADNAAWRDSVGIRWAYWGLAALAPILPVDGWVERMRSLPEATGPMVQSGATGTSAV